jgi:predicted  nucleic acid-binding Zn-ribbon protein
MATDEVSPPAGPKDEVKLLSELVIELRKERDLLADDAQVKTQMAVSLANAYYTAREALSSAKAASTSKDEQLLSNVSEVSGMRSQLQQQTSKAAAAERRCRDLETEVQALRHANEGLEAKAASAGQLEQEVQQLHADKEEMHATMEDWKAKVKEALKENRKKEQQHVQNEIELQRQIAKLQEQLDKMAFDMETSKARDTHARPRVDAEMQTRPMTPPSFSPAAMPAMPPPLPVSESALSPSANSGETSEVAPWMSPPAIKPEPTAEPAPPMIVTVHYGSPVDGWTVDTKTLVKAGNTVASVIVDVCERVNSRYGRNLDCGAMCLKTHHSKAKRFVLLSEHREMHSFTYFRKCQQENKPIVLQLEPIPANAIFASPTARLSTSRMSAQRTSEPRGW